MKIILPVDSKSLNSSVCQSFGRTPYYVLYETETKEVIFIDNEAASSAGGAGIKAAQMIVDKGAEVVITFRLGENAANVLNVAKIKLFKAQDGTADSNLKLFSEGKLLPLNEIHAGYHNHGSTNN